MALASETFTNSRDESVLFIHAHDSYIPNNSCATSDFNPEMEYDLQHIYFKPPTPAKF